MRDGQSVEFHGDACDDDDDGDELLDHDERERGTGVRNVDTDDDGLSDGTEVERGLDPLDDDSDGDSVIDGEDEELAYFGDTATECDDLPVTLPWS